MRKALVFMLLALPLLPGSLAVHAGAQDVARHLHAYHSDQRRSVLDELAGTVTVRKVDKQAPPHDELHMPPPGPLRTPNGALRLFGDEREDGAAER